MTHAPSDSLTNAIFETADALVVVMDRNGEFLRVNPKAQAVAEMTEAEMIGRPFWDVVLKASDAEFFRNLFSEKKLELARTKENVWISKSGKESIISWTNSVFPRGQRQNGAILSVGLDITERRATEQRLAHSERVNALGQLTAGVAHDFNNLLAVILGNAEEIRSPETRSEEHVQLAEEIIHAAKRGASLTKRLLSYGRRAHLEPKVVELNQEISQFASMAARVLPSSISLSLDLHGAPLEVSVDQTELDAALLNLVVNSRDALDGGGCIRLQVSPKELAKAETINGAEELPAGSYVGIRVSDNGSGMPSNVLKAAFDPFFSTKPEGQGSGLGLSMVHGFARQSGGAVSLNSTLGGGTSLEIFLPRAAASERVEDQAGHKCANTGQTRVLLVEDDAALRRIMQRFLSSTGLDVTSCGTAEDALELFDTGFSPDILVTDLRMPGALSGAELACFVRNKSPHTPVVIVSGYPTEARELTKDLSGGKPIVLQKPVSKKELIEAVTNLVGARTAT